MKTRLSKAMLVAAIGALLGIASVAMSPEPAVAAPLAPCGEVTGCWSVPDGCGVGVGCKHVTCLTSSCPGGDPQFQDCWYCVNEDPCEECSPAFPADESTW